MVRQVLVNGFFHGDPHDGNVLADPDSGEIVFLDLGQVGVLDRQQRIELVGLIHALKSVDVAGIGDSLLALGKQTDGFDEDEENDRLAHYSELASNAVSSLSRMGRV